MKKVKVEPATSSTAGKHAAGNRKKKDKAIQQKLEMLTAEAEDAVMTM